MVETCMTNQQMVEFLLSIPAGVTVHFPYIKFFDTFVCIGGNLI